MAQREAEAIGRRMKAAAERARLTSRELGEAIGVEDGTVRGWWRGRGQPNPERLRDYAAACGTSADDLLDTGGETRAELSPEGAIDWFMVATAPESERSSLAGLSDAALVHELYRRLRQRP